MLLCEFTKNHKNWWLLWLRSEISVKFLKKSKWIWSLPPYTLEFPTRDTKLSLSCGLDPHKNRISKKSQWFQNCSCFCDLAFFWGIITKNSSKPCGIRNPLFEHNYHIGILYETACTKFELKSIRNMVVVPCISPEFTEFSDSNKGGFFFQNPTVAIYFWITSAGR